MTEDDDPHGQWRALLGLAAIVAAIVGVLFVMQQVRQAGKLQDCFASGRRDCAPIEAGTR